MYICILFVCLFLFIITTAAFNGLSRMLINWLIDCKGNTRQVFCEANDRRNTEVIVCTRVCVCVEMSENNCVEFLDWLPPRFPATICCVVSSRDSHWPCLARLQQRHVYVCRLREMTDDAATHMIEHYFNTYNKVSALYCHYYNVQVWLAITLINIHQFL